MACPDRITGAYPDLKTAEYQADESFDVGARAILGVWPRELSQLTKGTMPVMSKITAISKDGVCIGLEAEY